MNRVWMAAGVAVANGHTDQGLRWKTGIKSFPIGMKMFISDAESPELLPIRTEITGLAGEGRRRVGTDESLREVMYMNCWGRS